MDIVVFVARRSLATGLNVVAVYDGWPCPTPDALCLECLRPTKGLHVMNLCLWQCLCVWMSLGSVHDLAAVQSQELHHCFVTQPETRNCCARFFVCVFVCLLMYRSIVTVLRRVVRITLPLRHRRCSNKAVFNCVAWCQDCLN